MKERMLQLLRADKSILPGSDIAQELFGLSRTTHYDLLVIAPS